MRSRAEDLADRYSIASGAKARPVGVKAGNPLP
jgi:hypothetical protein